jgi:hypothetical protein
LLSAASLGLVVVEGEWMGEGAKKKYLNVRLIMYISERGTESGLTVQQILSKKMRNFFNLV